MCPERRAAGAERHRPQKGSLCPTIATLAQEHPPSCYHPEDGRPPVTAEPEVVALPWGETLCRKTSRSKASPQAESSHENLSLVESMKPEGVERLVEKAALVVLGR